ncbi:MAG: hypothetical protein PVG20_00790 [Thioalkalispiraceae bacterium]|jgi:hypothetical protein
MRLIYLVISLVLIAGLIVYYKDSMISTETSSGETVKQQAQQTIDQAKQASKQMQKALEEQQKRYEELEQK